MDVFWIRTVSQMGIYVTFALSLFWRTRQGARWVPYLGMVGYALIFEHFNMLRYAHVQGGYHYHAASWLFLGDVPLYIPLAWAFIVSTSFALTDRLKLRPSARPFCDALLALLIDLSMDAVAIRLNFWVWHGVGLRDAFFGVPADNFLGWLLVTFTYSFLTRFLWRKEVEERAVLFRRIAAQWLLVPVAAYLLYLGLEAVVHSAYWLFHVYTLRGQLFVLAGVLVLFLIAAARPDSPSPFPVSAANVGTRTVEPSRKGTEGLGHELALHLPRHSFHLFAFIGLFCLPASRRSLALWGLAIIVWVIEAAVVWRARRRWE